MTSHSDITKLLHSVKMATHYFLNREGGRIDNKFINFTNNIINLCRPSADGEYCMKRLDILQVEENIQNVLLLGLLINIENYEKNTDEQQRNIIYDHISVWI